MSGETSISINATRVPDAEVQDWLRQAQLQKRRVSEENGVYRNILKRAKAAGVNLKAMTATMLATSLDPQQVQTDMRDTVRYMALRKLPVLPEHLFAGLDLDAMQSSRAHEDPWDAEDGGYRAGFGGTKIDECPYHAGSPFDVLWREHWNKGQAARARELGPDAEQVAAPRGRPPRQARIPGTETKQRAPGTETRKVAAKPPRRKKVGRVVTMPRRRRPIANGETQPAA